MDKEVRMPEPATPRRTAVIIRGNPNVGHPPGIDPSQFHGELRSLLEEQGYAVDIADSESYTMPPTADVWIGHSRGAGRFDYAPEGILKIPVGSHRPGAINHPGDDVTTPFHIVGGTPPPEHWMLTDDMKQELIRALSRPKSAVVEILRPRVESAVTEVRDPSTVTEAQREALNYKQSRIHVHGLRITIQAAKGQRRRPEWPPLQAHYGHILGVPARSRDGEHVDVFVGPDPDVETAFVGDLVNGETGKFDESKVFLGFPNRREAYAVFSTYPRQLRSGFYTLSMPQLKEWLRTGSARRPLRDQIAFFKHAGEDDYSGILTLDRGPFVNYVGPY